jgi:glycosyltransferase involved in cell wall biosynthesis
MKIACLVSSISRNAGGLHESVRRLCQSMNSLPSTDVHVLGMWDEHAPEDRAAWAPVPIHLFPTHGPRQFGYSPRMTRRLLELDVDIVLTNGLWMYPTVAALAWHRSTGRPFIMNPHGMLDRWALKNSPWKKRFAGFLHENSALREAACIRALGPSEAQAIRDYGLLNPLCVIPNGIDLPLEDAELSPPWKGQVGAGHNVLLYLGRFHPKKGLSLLLRAWALLRQLDFVPAHDWDLALAGWSQNGHEQELKDLAGQLGIMESVHFLGPQFGEGKSAAYHSADAFVLPSFSEGLPMVALEAWAHRLPVLMTPQCHLPEGFDAGAAIAMASEVNSMVEGLKTLFSMNTSARAKMGCRGYQLAAEEFNWPRIGAQMHEVCQWLLGRAGPPDCLATRQPTTYERSFI